MEAYKILTKFNEGLQQWIKSLPIKTGQKVEIIILPEEKQKVKNRANVLKGTVISYEEPFKAAINTEDWEVLK